MTINKRKNKIVNIILAATVSLFLLFSLLTPSYLNQKDNNWSKEVESRVFDYEFTVLEKINSETEKLLEADAELSSAVSNLYEEKDVSISKLFDIVNQKPFSNFSIQIFNNSGKIIVWNDLNAFDYEEIVSSQYEDGECYFRNYGLHTFLSLDGSVEESGRLIFYSISLPLEKNYSLDNEYFVPLSLSESFSNEFNTDVEIKYDRLAERSKDGRDYSFDILNNFGNKIGVVNISKPTRDYEINRLSLLMDGTNSLILILIIITLIYKYSYYYIEIKNIYVRILVFVLFVLGLRVALFALHIPSQFLENDLLNASYFSSVFAYGIVRSPLEFFITAASVVIIAVWLFLQVIRYQINENQNTKTNLQKIGKILFGIFLIVLLLFILRGLGASVKSVIFDSTLRYFKDPSLLPGLPALLMHLNILLLGFCAVVAGTICITLMRRIFFKKSEGFAFKYELGLFIILQLLAFLFDYFQKQPQGTAFTRFSYISIAYTISILTEKITSLKLQETLYFAFAASFVTILMLNFYNSELEKESLKLTANELVRPNENYLDYSVYQTLNQASNAYNLEKSFTDSTINKDQIAFKIWSNSVLQKEAIRSRVELINPDHEITGEFNFLFNEEYEKLLPSDLNESQNFAIVRIDVPEEDSKIISGVSKYVSNNRHLGYIRVSVVYNMNRLNLGDIPPFLTSTLRSYNTTVDINKLKIFDFHDGKLVNSISSFVLSEEQLRSIVADDFSDLNEKWLSTDINGEPNVIYVLKENQEDIERIIAVVYEERNISWNLFDFFKVFFLQTIFILLITILFLSVQLFKSRDIKFTFRSKLLVVFLVISIIPSILLAVYFKDLTEEKNESATFYKLSKRARNVENYINKHLDELSMDELISRISDDLGIHFSLYENGELKYSTEAVFNKVGLFSTLMDPVAYNNVFYKGMKECLISNSIEDYNYKSYYTFVNLDNHIYEIEINDLFNPILLPLTELELDVILFGSYSLVAILVLIISTLLANQISRPIRRLSNATKSVASGDLNINLEGNWKGEMKELQENFNKMVKDLKVSQNELAEIERESAWKEMAKQVAHEVKNPLTPMKLSVQQLIIAHKDNSPKFNEIFDKVTATVMNQIDTLKNIASEFSNFARMPSIKISEVNTAKVLESVKNLFADERVKMFCDIRAENVIIQTDEDHLKRTLVNLIRNSLQAKASEVCLVMDEDEKNLFIRVKDNGMGIPEGNVDKVFEKDFTTKTDGMGIGLAMAKRFLTSQAGDIKVENTSADGTTILIRIPK